MTVSDVLAWPTVDPVSSAIAWLALALMLGIAHAFDADHVMALSVFATRKAGVREGVKAGLCWAGGHGLVLLTVGMALLLLGQSLSSDAAAVAERLVGLMMIVLGVMVWVDLLRSRRHLHFHQHDELLPHAHWHDHERQDHRHEHAAVLVGAMHGIAGSAPILAVIPAAAHSPWLGLSYLIVFAAGVALAMAIVSGLLGHWVGRISQNGQVAGLSILRGLSATGSVTLGLWLTMAS